MFAIAVPAAAEVNSISVSIPTSSAAASASDSIDCCHLCKNLMRLSVLIGKKPDMPGLSLRLWRSISSRNAKNANTIEAILIVYRLVTSIERKHKARASYSLSTVKTHRSIHDFLLLIIYVTETAHYASFHARLSEISL